MPIMRGAPVSIRAGIEDWQELVDLFANKLPSEKPDVVWFIETELRARASLFGETDSSSGHPWRRGGA